MLADHHLIDLAVDIEPDEIRSETLDAGDNFYFLITIPESGLLRIYTQSSLDTYGELMETNETEIAVADDGGENGNFLIESMIGPGQYLIRVAGATPFETGPFNIVTEFTSDSEPVGTHEEYTERENLKLLMTATQDDIGSAAMSIGSFKVGEPVLESDFASGDEIVLLGTVFPDASHIGQTGEIFMVLRSNLNTWSYRDPDGNFQAWNISLRSLEPAYVIDSLEAQQSIELYQGTLEAGDHRIFMGYSLEGGTLIFNGIAYRFTVAE